ncbi:MAG TPA: two-component regulator propeller domain-containing protein [Vicinamibacterales bacterium]|jgi:signal transduction histidine kinase/ligand-binding sensor domain-containing protein|nr:two-component regulator propeller domain-containing protein [Vicinamibacterales bacterium]
MKLSRPLHTLAVCVLAGAPAFASSRPHTLDGEKSIGQFTHTSWSARDGIPGPVRAITQTPDGYLWLGTEAGLYRFDGLQFEAWKSNFGEKLPSGSVWSLCRARDGGLWIGSGSSGISRLLDGHLTNYSPDDRVPRGGVLSIVEDHDGSIWAGGQYGLSKFERGEWRRIGAEMGYTAPGAQALFVDHRGALWVATDGFNFQLMRNDPVKRNSILTLARGDSQFKTTGEAVGMVWSMANGPDEQVWIADTNGHSVRPIGVRPRSPLRMSTGEETLCLVFDADRRLWVGLLEGGVRRGTAVQDSGGKAADLDRFRPSDGLSGSVVYSAFRDREDNIWFGTGGGLDQFRENKVVAFSAAEGLEPDQRIALTSAGDRGVWIISYTRDVVRRFERGRFLSSPLPPLSRADPPRILSLFADATGHAWVTGNFGVAEETGSRFWYVHAADVEKGASVEALARDASGNLWIELTTLPHARGVEYARRILRFHDRTWTDVSRSGDLPRYRSRVLHVDAKNRVWFGFENGEVALYEAGRFQRYSSADGLPKGRILAITDDRRGDVWVAGEGGLSRFDRGRFVTLSQDNGLPGTSISAVLEDDEGFLWLACALGIFRVEHQQLERALGSPSYRMQGLTIGASDGLRGLPRQREPFPTATRAMDGRLWFATTGGIAVIDPRRLTTNLIVPPVIVEAIKADDRVLAASSDVRLQPNTRNLDFSYAALSLTDPHKVQFRYKLEGYDRDWRGPIGARQVTYMNLPPRRYRFRVIAANNDGLWNEDGATLDFTILPAFYQTSAFRLSAVLLLAIAGWAAYARHVRGVARQLNLRFGERLAERERIARDLHDTLLQGIQGVIFRFHAAAQQLPEPSPVREVMERVLERADQVLVEGRDRVKDLRTSVDGVTNLAAALARVGRELAVDTRIEFAVFVEGDAREVNALVRDEAYWIAHEAMVNAFHHGQARHIEVEIAFNARQLRVRVRDDGCGVDSRVLEAGGKPGHWGMAGMRERAWNINGRIDTWSRHGVGTEVELRIPGRIAYTLNATHDPRLRLARGA